MPGLVVFRGRTSVNIHQPFVARKLEACNDVELNPGPRSESVSSPTKTKKVNNRNNSTSSRMNTGSSQESNTPTAVSNVLPVANVNRVERLEQELVNVQTMMSNLDTSMITLLETIETMKPAYVHAMRLMSTAQQPTADQKNNLVFYGLAPDPLEVQMEKEPEFCRDILETRVKMIFRENLKISRDIPFITVYRFTTGNNDPNEIRPIVAAFRSQRDKENILRHTSSSKILKQKGVYVTEDFSSKRQVPKNNKKSAQSETLKTAEEKIKKSLGNNKLVVVDNQVVDLGITDGVSTISSSAGLLAASDSRINLESSAGMSDRMSSCNSDYAPSSNSGNSSSGAFTDD